MSWAFGLPTLRPALADLSCRAVSHDVARLVLVRLAEHANDQGVAWPSHATLARSLDLAPSTIKRAIACLEQMGLVDVEPCRRRNGSSGSNRYRLALGTPGPAGPGEGVPRDPGRGSPGTPPPEPSVEPSIEPLPPVARELLERLRSGALAR